MVADISTVGVVGLGTMGAGIMEVFARGGLAVVGVESTPEYAERGQGILTGSLDRAVAKGRLSSSAREDVLTRVRVTTSMDALAPVDLVVEAVPETMELKQPVFAALDGIVRSDAVLASNTSSLSITDIAAGTGHPERVVGLHFFNPAPVLQLVEVITTLRTDPGVTAAVTSTMRGLGKKPVVVGDRAGFVVNYLLFGYLSAAMRMLEHGHVSREDLDTAMRVGAGLPMGPLTLMDLIGLDVCNDIGEVIYGYSRSPAHAPSSMLAQLVTTGRRGRKSGRGFYTFAGPGSSQVVADETTPPSAPPVEVGAVGVVGEGVLATEIVGRLTEGGYAVTHRPGGGDLGDLTGVDLVIEACSEDTEVEDLFAELGQVTAAGTMLATTTTSAVDAGVLSGRAVDCACLRLHAPTGNGQVVEIGRSSVTSDRAVALLRAVVSAIGAEPVLCRDRTGLVVDALLVPHLNDAVRMLEQGYAGAADIDTAVRFGLGYPRGPLEMIDHLGADEVLAACEDLFTGTDGFQAHLLPSPLLVEHALLDRPFIDG